MQRLHVAAGGIPSEVRKFLVPEVHDFLATPCHDGVIVLRVLRLGHQLILERLGDDTEDHGLEQAGTVFELGSVHGQDVKPIIEVFAQLLDIVASSKLLEPADSSELDSFWPP